jgi:short-subunit dehydrogenase
MSRIALVTGATAGIGHAFAHQLAARGYRLVLVARDAARLDGLAHDLATRYRAEAEAIPADLSVESGIARIEAYLATTPVDVLVNNAGFVTKGVLGQTAPAGQVAMVQLHVVAVNRLILAALPGMLARGRGDLITVSSVSSYIMTGDGGSNYSATKCYQRVLMESLSRALRGTDVYAQALCPGFTHTELHQRAKLDLSYVPRSLWLSADEVVAASLRAMDARGPTVVVPGLQWKAIVALAKFLPSGLLGRRRRLARRTN